MDDYRPPTSHDVADALHEICPNLSYQILADIEEMPIDEAIGYAFTLIEVNTDKDPEQSLRKKGILE